MSRLAHEIYGHSVERDDLERLSADDMATLREAEFRHAALAHLQASALRAAAQPRGTCANCGEVCTPAAHYCDDDCRDDHQQRQAGRRRAGLLVRNGAGD